SQAGVYCTQVDSSGPTKYILRSIQVDLKSGVCNRISLLYLGPLGQLICPDTYFTSNLGARKNWAKG
ncbi:hypothetical protein BD769DRAFT_1327584, partial [Suillus cothurnatus]